MTQTPLKILIIGPAWVGDMVMAQVLFKLLKKNNPNSIITLLAPSWTRDLVSRMPEINAIIDLPFKHGEFNILKRYQLGRLLSKHNYNHAIVLPNSWKSALIPFFAGIKNRIGFKGECRYGLLNTLKSLNKQKYPLMIQRFALLSLNSGEDLPDSLPYPELLITTINPTNNNKQNKKIIALCPGAEFGPSKRWPEAYYADIALYLRQKNYAVYLLGSEKDKIICDNINQLTQNQCDNFAGKTSLSQAIDLLAQSSLVITNDSGLMHIAAAVNNPVIIALYGSTDPNFTPPLSSKAHILSIELDCRPCFKRECPLSHHHCMTYLTPAKIKEVITQCGF